ncbi:hypothetical protein ACFHW2_41600 [Actinomadura sp. LOL_016]|uniref:hypothetical protein n=1 Tax=unclassified Actinomadura TaxID=2626254 RepID=UPI003A7F8633
MPTLREVFGRPRLLDVSGTAPVERPVPVADPDGRALGPSDHVQLDLRTFGHQL